MNSVPGESDEVLDGLDSQLGSCFGAEVQLFETVEDHASQNLHGGQPSSALKKKKIKKNKNNSFSIQYRHLLSYACIKNYIFPREFKLLSKDF